MIKHFWSAVIFLFLLSGLVLAGDAEGLSLKSIFKDGHFSAKSISGIRSMNDGQHYSILKDGDIIQFSYKTGEVTDTLFHHIIGGDTIAVDDYSFAGNEQFILLVVNQKPVYRHSYTAEHFVFNRKTNQVVAVAEGRQQFALLSPDGAKVAYVDNNNIFIVDLNTAEQEQITSDGSKNFIINGMPDWVYEEEFTLTDGLEWSNDGKKLAYYRVDESAVKNFMILRYNDLYPEQYAFKYPKAGEENSKVDVYVYDVEKHSQTKMETGVWDDQYIPRIKWTNTSEQLCVTVLNRNQNEVKLLMCDAGTGAQHTFYSETSKTYISEFTDDFATFLANGKVLIMSDKSGYMHFYLYQSDGNLVNKITHGNYEVDELLGVDEKNKLVYYTSAEASPLERHIYAVSLDGRKKEKLSGAHGTYNAWFSATFDFYIESFSQANKPPVYTLKNRKAHTVRVIEDNKVLMEKMVDLQLPQKQFFSFVNSSGETLNGFQILPVDFDSTQTYPLFMYVYGGPESQEVQDAWDYFLPWFQMLAQQGYVVACVDNRGTEGRGVDFEKSTYKQLGNLETQDQIDAARYLSSKAYIDASRVGIFGWSYGGYLSLLCLMKGNDVFKMAVAVAPVTNWRFYDTIYTERFMQKPSENASGYDDNSPINHVNELKGKLLLVHGSADDNVHIQNTYELASKLVAANKAFDMQIYTDKNHSIYGGNTRLHLFTKITGFIHENL